MADAPTDILKSCATQLREHASYFANLSPYVGADELEIERDSISSIRAEVAKYLDSSKKSAFSSSISEAEMGIRALLRSIHRDKDTSRQFFKEAEDVAKFLKNAAALLSAMPPVLMMIQS